MYLFRIYTFIWKNMCFYLWQHQYFKNWLPDCKNDDTIFNLQWPIMILFIFDCLLIFHAIVFFPADIVLFLCEKEHVEGGMIFQLLEDLTEMSTMRNCKDVFGYIESKQDILGKVSIILLLYFAFHASQSHAHSCFSWICDLFYITNLSLFFHTLHSQSSLPEGSLLCWEHAISCFVVYQRFSSLECSSFSQHVYSYIIVQNSTVWHFSWIVAFLSWPRPTSCKFEEYRWSLLISKFVLLPPIKNFRMLLETQLSHYSYRTLHHRIFSTSVELKMTLWQKGLGYRWIILLACSTAVSTSCWLTVWQLRDQV